MLHTFVLRAQRQSVTIAQQDILIRGLVPLQTYDEGYSTVYNRSPMTRKLFHIHFRFKERSCKREFHSRPRALFGTWCLVVKPELQSRFGLQYNACI